LSLIRFLFGWDGRIRGGQLLVSAFGVGILSTLLSMALTFAFVPQEPSGGWIADERFLLTWFIGQIPGLISTYALAARRLHDLGYSAIWLIPGSAYAAAIQVAAIVWPSISNDGRTFVFILPILAASILLIAAPGQQHANRYGPPPAP
jgi:uncharacterized membrane protein YhaH (DUF805 family)